MSDEEDTAILLDRNELSSKGKKVTAINNIMSNLNNKKNKAGKLKWISAIVTFLGGISFGYDMVVLVNYLNTVSDIYTLMCTHQAVLLYIWIFGGVFGFITGPIIDCYGCRQCIQLSTYINITGTIMLVLSPWAILMYAARLLLGFGNTFSAIAHCILATELSSSTNRGFRVTLHQFGIAVGVLCGLCAGLIFTEEKWKIAICLNIIPMLIDVQLTRWFLPHYTPLRKRSIRDGDHLSPIMTTTVVESAITIVIFILLLQFSGRFTVLKYAPQLFFKLGINKESSAHIASLTLGAVRFICTGVSLFIVDRLGRRPCLIMSVTIMMFSIGTLAMLTSTNTNALLDLEYTFCPDDIMADSSGVLAFSSNSDHANSFGHENIMIPPETPPPYPLLPTPVSLIQTDEYVDNMTDVLAVIAMLVFEATHALGPATLMWLLGCEMFPTYFRGHTVAAFVPTALWLSNMFILGLRMEEKISEMLSFSGAFMSHSLICLLYVIYIFLFITETKGKTLDQIYIELQNVSLFTRICRHLRTLPFIDRSVWLQHKASQRRNVSIPNLEQTNI